MDFQDRYEIQRQLGKKAGRQTLLAVDRVTQTQVILKLLTLQCLRSLLLFLQAWLPRSQC
jgi:hypothetical protein